MIASLFHSSNPTLRWSLKIIHSRNCHCPLLNFSENSREWDPMKKLNGWNTFFHDLIINNDIDQLVRRLVHLSVCLLVASIPEISRHLAKRRPVRLWAFSRGLALFIIRETCNYCHINLTRSTDENCFFVSFVKKMYWAIWIGPFHGRWPLRSR